MRTRFTTGLLVVSMVALYGCGQSFASVEAAGTTSDSSGSSGGAGGEAGGGGGATTGVSGGAPDSGGSGTAPCDAVDHDGDGLSQCDGDCDDGDPLAYPGALEICGDGVDEDCDGADDSAPPCNGLGTFVSQLNGVVGGKGTMDEPVATISEGIAHAQQIGIPTAVLVSAGVYVEDLKLTGAVSLRGGYDPGDWAARDVKAFVTTIKSISPGGLQIIAADKGASVDGFSILGPNVGDGNDSVAVLVDSGSPLLSNDTIKAGNVSAGTGTSVGVRVISSSAIGGDVELVSSVVSSGSSNGASYGVEVAASAMNVVLKKNEITAGKGTDSVALMISKAGDVKASHNVFQSGVATGSNNLPSSSLGVWARAGDLLLDSNLLNPDQFSNPPVCFTPSVWCGGARVSTKDAVLTNNIVNGSASGLSAGLHLLQVADDLSGVVVSSNLISAGGHDDAGSISAAVLLEVPGGQNNKTAGRIRNNILIGGLSENNYGIWEQQIFATSVDPAALDHNLFYFPINMPNAGVLYRDYNGVSGSDINMLDMLPGAGQNLLGNPKLSADGHLLPDSPCRNTGTDIDAPAEDYDLDPRPQEGAYDIGPDELLSK